MSMGDKTNQVKTSEPTKEKVSGCEVWRTSDGMDNKRDASEGGRRVDGR